MKNKACSILLFVLMCGSLWAETVLERTKINFDQGLTEVTDIAGKVLVVSQRDVISPPIGKDAYKVNNGWKIREYTCNKNQRTLKDANYNMGLVNIMMLNKIDYKAVIAIVRPFMSSHAFITEILDSKTIKIYDSEINLTNFCNAFLNAEELLIKK
ncbi:MAG: hypothetical protein A2381_06220 [Bdellovibrionales bacterium RIFOXYB1_FULL_37_110]|nr:MAG: hypothetical protein A2417_02495 [Bdellovibrionales bacterium RIFOXYC1_FULL_37_79]OFZ60100.1 MAG: hypothetical protein A2381_06220 [Bdellovibrionales bacterium RIFOXYB1_FULL_37_110]OFZ63437.1 MAG: hypothetical protein A2577_00065 [Bdellovibrionales bacterium RIFOXYD1_FULL_36_51]